jgi:hypothetical protein
MIQPRAAAPEQKETRDAPQNETSRTKPASATDVD